MSNWKVWDAVAPDSYVVVENARNYLEAMRLAAFRFRACWGETIEMRAAPILPPPKSMHHSGQCPQLGCPQPCGACGARVYRDRVIFTQIVTIDNHGRASW